MFFLVQKFPKNIKNKDSVKPSFLEKIMKDIDLNEIFKKVTFEDNKEKNLITERIMSEEYSFFYGQSKEKVNRKTWLGLAMIQASLYNTLNQFNIKVDTEEKAKKQSV